MWNLIKTLLGIYSKMFLYSKEEAMTIFVRLLGSEEKDILLLPKS